MPLSLLESAVNDMGATKVEWNSFQLVLPRMLEEPNIEPLFLSFRPPSLVLEHLSRGVKARKPSRETLNNS